ALYLADEWSVGDRLRVDLGLSMDSASVDASISNGGEHDEDDLDGDPATRYDVAAFGGGSRTQSSEESAHLNWFAGFNYPRTARLAVFGHLTRSAKLPHFDDIRNGVTMKDRVTNAELGYKTSHENLAVFLTAYRTEFDNVPFNDILADG